MSFLGGNSRGARRASSIGAFLSLVLFLLFAPAPSAAATIQWTNAAGGAWNVAANWNPQQVPTAADDVLITALGMYTVTLAGNVTVANLTIGVDGLADSSQPQTVDTNGWTLTVTGATVIDDMGQLLVDSGTFRSATYSVAGKITVNNGTLGGSAPGTLTLAAPGGFGAPGGTLTLGGTGYPILDALTITNNHTITYTGTGYLALSGSTVINNDAAFNIENDQQIWNSSGTNVLNNGSSGTITKSPGTGTTDVTLPLNNGGAVVVSSGSLELSGTSSHSGSFAVASGAKLRIEGSATQTFNAGTTISGAGTLELSSGQINVAASVIFETAVFDMLGGTLAGSAARTIKNTFNLKGGTLTGAGTTTIDASTGIVNIPSGYPTLDGHVLMNLGAINYTSTATYLSLANGSTLNNAGSMTIDGAISIYAYGTGTNNLVNTGVITKSGTPSELYIHPPLINGGTINVQSGILRPQGGGTCSGPINVSAGALMKFHGATHTFLTGSTLAGTGTVEVSSGALNADNPLAIDVATFLLSGGTLGGAANRTINNAFEWRSGTVTGSAGTTTTVASTGSMLFPSGTGSGYGYPTLDGHTLVLNAPSTYSTSYYFSLANGAVLSNAAALTMTGDAQIYAYGSPASQIANASTGSITKSGGTGIAYLYPLLNNDGTVTAASGTLAFMGGGTSSGAFVASGTLRFGGGTHSLGAPSSVSGAGQIEFTAGTVNLSGTVNVTGTTVVSGGTVALLAATASTAGLTITSGTLDSGGAISVGSAFIFNGGALKGSGTTTVPSSATSAFITSPGYPTIEGHTLVLQTSTTFGGSGAYYLTMINGAILQNSGTFTIQDNSYIYGYGTPAPRIDNSGTFRKTGGTGDTYIYPALNNSGSVEVTTGTLTLFGGGSSSGSFVATAPGTLRFASSSSQVLTAASSVSGTGTVRFNSGAVSIAGSYALTGSGLTLLDGGTATLAGGSTPGLTLGNGTLETTAPLAVSGALIFNGGTLKGAGTTTVLASASAAFMSSAGYPTLDAHTLVLQTNSTFGSGTFATYLTMINGAVLQNGATLTIIDDSYIYGYGTPAPRVDNAGIFRKTGGTGESYIYPAFDNSGTTEVSTGTLSLYGGGTSSGTFTATSPGALRFLGATSTLTAASSVGGTGTVQFSGGTTSVGGTYTLTGAGLTLFNGGTASFGAASTPNLTMTSGALEATASFTVSGAFTFNGGTLKGTGTTTVLASGSASFAGSGYPTLDAHTLVLEGNATLGGGTHAYYLTMTAGSVMQNNAAFTIVDDSYVYGFGTPAPAIENSGTFAKSGGAATSAIYPAMINGGTVAASAGTLALYGGGSGAGAYTATSPGTLQFAGGTHALSGAIGGDGTLGFTSGTVNVSGSFASSGLTSITFGTLNLGIASASMQNVDLAGGTLTGSAQIAVDGTMNWPSGTLSGTTILEIAAAPAALNLTGTGTRYLLGATVRNGGSASWSGSGWVYGNQAGSFVNLPGATFTRTDSGAFYYYCCTGAAPRFENQAGATFSRDGAATTSQFYGADVTNAGTIVVTAGTLQFFSTPFVQTAGAFSIAPGATVLSNGPFDIQGGALLGGGTFTGNVVNSGGAVKPGTSPGALTIEGSYTQGAAGVLDVEIGGVTAGTEFDQLNVAGTASLGGTLNVIVLSPYVPADGSTYRFLTFGSLAPSPANAFTTTNGTSLGAGDTLQLTAGATYFDLVTNGNAAPAAVGDAVSTPEDTPASISVLANDSDPDGNAISVSGFTPAANGTAGCGTATCTYVPNANFFGSDAFTYTVTDGFTSSTATVAITVTSVNDPPIAGADAAATSANAPVTINVLANDTDIDGGSLSVTAFTNGSLGTVSCSAGACTYTPSGTAGTDAFTYTVSDGVGGQATASVTVTVTAIPCPGPVSAVSPSSGEQVAGSGTLYWSGGAGADQFKVYLGPAGSGCTTLFATTAATQIAYTGLAAGEYDWKVVAEKAGCEVPQASACVRFTVSDPCPNEAPALVAPEAGAERTPDVRFEWTVVANATQYHLTLFSAATGQQELALIPQPAAPSSTVSTTVNVPTGTFTWRVVADFPDGCPSVSSSDRLLTVARECPTGTPEPIAPLESTAIDDTPVLFRWTPVSGTVRYELFLSINGSAFQSAGTVDGAVADPALPAHVPAGATLSWYVEAEMPEGCGVAQSRTVVVSVSCFPPVLSLQGEVTSDKPYQVRATIVSVGVAYAFQESLTPDFATVNAEKSGIVDPTGEFIYADFEHPVAEPRAYYYRAKVDQEGCAFSGVGRIVVVPLPPPTSTDTETVVQFGNEEEIRQPLFIPSPTPDQQTSYTYIAATDRDWMRVEPAGGTIGPAGVTVTVITNPVGLPVGTNTGTVTLTFIALAGGKGALETTPSTTATPVSVTLVTPVTNGGKEGPNAESLIIPAVAHATGVNSEWQSDVRILNLGSEKRKYQLLWTSTATDATLSGKNCELELAAGQSAALDDFVKQWYGLGSLPGESAQGVLEIRPLGAGGPGKGAAGVPVTRSLVSLASSRMYNRTPQGTLGEFIPAIPFASFVGGSTPPGGKKSVLSLQQLAQSSAYRTNIGVAEAAGKPVSVEMRFFAADGSRILTVPLDLKSGEHRQLNQILAMNDITNIAVARAEVEVVSGDGKITAYASVIDNVTGDPLQVHAVDLAKIGARKYVMPGVAHFNTGQARWRTDIQVFNAGAASVSAQVAFFPVGASAPTKTATIQVDPGRISTLSDVVPTLFGESNTGGAVQISTAANSELVVTGRTYDQRESGSYGQFMAAVTEEEAIGLGDRAMQVLQLEQSSNIRSNLGIVEVSGKEVRVELSAFPAESRVSPRVELTLGPNEFRQLNQVLKSLNAGTTYNARIALRVVGGDGKIVAYGSTVDNMTQDPTFIPGQ